LVRRRRAGRRAHEPLPLVPGTYQQGPLRFELRATDDGVGDWHLTHDPVGSFPGMSFRAEPTSMDAFAERHQWLSTSPESGFVRVATAQARHAEGVDIMRGCVLTLVRGGDRLPPTTFERRDDWYAVLEDQLGLRLDVGDDAERLWPRSRPSTAPWVWVQADRFLGRYAPQVPDIGT
jgi:arylamine N-acetyltransferase